MHDTLASIAGTKRTSVLACEYLFAWQDGTTERATRRRGAVAPRAGLTIVCRPPRLFNGTLTMTAHLHLVLPPTPTHAAAGRRLSCSAEESRSPPPK